MLTNAAPRGTAEAVALSFLDLVLRGMVERDYLTLLPPVFEAEFAPNYGTTVDYTAPPANRAQPLSLSAYTGTYANDFWGEIEVALVDGGLELRAGPNKMPFAMWHWDRDTFLFQPTGENAYGPSGMMFEIGPDGQAAAVTIEYFNIQGQGRLTRVPTAP